MKNVEFLEFGAILMLLKLHITDFMLYNTVVKRAQE